MVPYLYNLLNIVISNNFHNIMCVKKHTNFPFPIEAYFRSLVSFVLTFLFLFNMLTVLKQMLYATDCVRKIVLGLA